MSTRKSTINDINVSLEPLYLITLPGNNTLVSFDSDGNVINSDISTSTVSNFFNNTDTQVLSTILTDYDYTNSIGYILPTDTLLIALQKVQYQLDVIELSKGANNGIATLDSFGKLLSSQIPASLIGAMVYQGTWDASTNTPILVSSTGNKGHYYIVSTPGVTNIDGISVWNANDWIVFDGSTWEKIDNSTVNVLNTPLNGLSTGINTPIISTNSILTAFQNTQAQLDNKANIISGTQNYLPYFSTNNALSTSTIYHSAISNINGSSTLISSNNTATESLTINNFSGNKLVGIRNDGRFIFRSTSIQINDINNTESSAIYIGAGDNVYNTHFHLASRLTGNNDFMSFYNTGASLKTFYYDYNSVLNLQSINTTNSTSLLKMYKSDGTQILSFNNNGLVIGTTPQDVSSVIDLQTITQGLGMPKLLTSQKISITTNRSGLTVYDDTLKSLSFWTGTEWASTLNNTVNGTTYAMPYYNSHTSLSSSSLQYGGSSSLLSLTDVDISDKTIFTINSFGSTDNFKVAHNYTTDKTTFTYNKLNQIVANLSDGDVKIGGTSHISSLSSSSDHISFTDVATNINVWRTSNTGNTFIRTTDNTATNKFFTFTNFGGTQIGYIENGGMVIGSTTRNTNLTLDLQSITQAVGLPVLTTLAENNIAASSRIGMFLYNSDLSKLRYSNGVSWISVVDSSFFLTLSNNYVPYWDGSKFINGYINYSPFGFGTDDIQIGQFATNKTAIVVENSNKRVSFRHSNTLYARLKYWQFLDAGCVTGNGVVGNGLFLSERDPDDGTNNAYIYIKKTGTMDLASNVSGFLFYQTSQIAGLTSSGLSLGSSTINTSTQLDLQSTTKGLGLPLVPTASLPTASTRKGNMLFDSTANILKVSNGTTWLDVSVGGDISTEVWSTNADYTVSNINAKVLIIEQNGTLTAPRTITLSNLPTGAVLIIRGGSSITSTNVVNIAGFVNGISTYNSALTLAYQSLTLYSLGSGQYTTNKPQFTETTTSVSTSKILRGEIVGVAAQDGFPTLPLAGDMKNVRLNNYAYGLAMNMRGGSSSGFISQYDARVGRTQYANIGGNPNLKYWNGDEITSGNIPTGAFGGNSSNIYSGWYYYEIYDVVGRSIRGHFFVNTSGVPSSLTPQQEETSGLSIAITGSPAKVVVTNTNAIYARVFPKETTTALTKMPELNKKWSVDGTVESWNGDFVLGSASLNTATTLDLQSTTKGLGLPLVPTASLPTASTRKGNLLFDSTTNTLKVSDGTNWVSPLIPSGLTTNYLPHWNGSTFVNSNFFINSTDSFVQGASFNLRNTSGSNIVSFSLGGSALVDITSRLQLRISGTSVIDSDATNFGILRNLQMYDNTGGYMSQLYNGTGTTSAWFSKSVRIGDATGAPTVANTVTCLDLASTTLGLGLNLVSGDLGTTRNGLIWYDTITNQFKGVQNSTVVSFGSVSVQNGLKIEDNTIKLGGELIDDNTRLTVNSPNKNFFIGEPIIGQDLQFISLSSTVFNINNHIDHNTAQGNTMYITPGGLSSINQYLPGVQTALNGNPESVSIRYSDDKVFKLYLFGGLNSGETLTINDITFTEGVDFFMQGDRDLDVEQIIDTLTWDSIPNFLSVKKEFGEFNEPVIIVTFSEISTITHTISNLSISSYQNEKRVLVDKDGVLLKSRNNEITLTDDATIFNSNNISIFQSENGVIKNTLYLNTSGSFLTNRDATDSSVSSSSVMGGYGSTISNFNNKKIELQISGEILSGETFTVNGITFTEGIDFATVNNPDLDALAIANIDYSSVPNFVSVSSVNNFVTFTFSVADNTITTTITNSYVANHLFTTSVFAGKDFALMQSNNSGLQIGDTGHIFSDNTSEKQGLRYAGDYSATYTDRSLVDKAYADSLNTNALDKDTVKLAENINKGQVVYVSGANGTNIIVSKASNATEATSSKTFGLLETSGVTNDIVNVVTRGLLSGLDTSTATIGDAVWLGTDGNLIYGLTNKPYAPAHLVFIGIVTRVHSENGEIFVSIQNGFELDEIHNVSITTPNDNQALTYENSTGLWKNKAVNLGLTYTSGTPIVTMTGTDTFTLDTANYTKYNYTSLASSTTVYNVTNTQTMIEFTDAAFDQLVNLPDATTCNLGQQFNFINSNATNPVTIRNFVGVTIGIIGITATECTITCVSNTTASGSWNIRQNDRAIALRIATSAGTTHNSATAIDIQLTNKGLGLPLVPTDSLPTASLRTGNLLFDSTTNTLKVSDGTNWNNVNTGVSSAVMVGILDADQSVTTSTDISPNFVAQADPNSWFNSGTQRVTPTIAGYYNVSYSVWWGANSSTNQVNVQIRKNGNSQAIYQRLSSSVAVGFTMGGSKVVYMNGTTDYFDFVVFTSDANTIFKGNVDGSGTYFSVHLLR